MKTSIFNSTLALTSSFLITIVLHEIAHYIVAIILGYNPVLFHNRVEYSNTGSIYNHMWIAAAGPVFSLIQGFFAYQIAKKMNTSAKSLFVLWFGIAGLITFFGYLMIAPLISIGDTGKVFNILQVPMPIQIVIAILAIIGITIILMKSTREFERFAIEDYESIKLNRKKWSMSLILIPLLLSILLITILQFPIPHVASILATTCGPFSIMAVFGTFIGSKEKVNRDLRGESINKGLSIFLISVFILIIILNRILVNGI